MPLAGPPPAIVMEMEAKLMAVPTRRVIGTFTATTRAMAQANNVDSIVQAFNQAAGEALGQIVNPPAETLELF